MEITLSRKTLSIAAATAVLLLGVGGWFAWRNGLLNQLLPTTVAAAAPAPTEPAFAALSAMYSPNMNAPESAWESQVCAGMTSDGCNLFEKMYAPAIWSAAKAGKISKMTLAFVSVAQTLPDTPNTGASTSSGEQVWKLSTSDQFSPYVYAQVQQDSATHQWMLVRLLFSQEAQARYGQ